MYVHSFLSLAVLRLRSTRAIIFFFPSCATRGRILQR